MTYYRTCQECGKVHVHNGKDPNHMTIAEFAKYCDRPCGWCKSPALDFGSTSDPRIPVKDEDFGLDEKDDTL